ncbi:hypothetical protein [Methylobacterium persicinum]|uniref:Uncharacterized protein n=1 Tax=Methylobacterium persicinum TaxID=374426 RepID=A0ABU0HPQ4_9HYPH|nr:hypothetical protein [Methylobacterium persicinum]MDQ0444304.1 hypothetical protein [Methylobacterium persicinum]GJE36264.1 hypothetical protein KHHGKMAE_0312 [Methylobacterium persicinum]
MLAAMPLALPGALLPVAAFAQQGLVPSNSPRLGPSISGPTLPPALPSSEPDAQLTLTAILSGVGTPLQDGLVWRIFDDRGEGARPAIVGRSNEAEPHFTLPPGAYVATVTYGFASASKRIVLGGQAASDTLRVAAGALRLSGAVGDTKIPPDQVTFSVFVPVGTNSEGRLVRSEIHTGELLRLPEGTYHVVSTYGESNAIQRADLKVENGKVTEATLNHRAATVTLKLVAAPGSEAFAGTAFSVLTPGGDTIREAIGAFPQVTLAEGDYVLIARHDGQVYTHEFKVESGLDRDIEVLARTDAKTDAKTDTKPEATQGN